MIHDPTFRAEAEFRPQVGAADRPDQEIPFITLPMLRGGNIAKSHAGTLGAAQHGETGPHAANAVGRTRASSGAAAQPSIGSVDLDPAAAPGGEIPRAQVAEGGSAINDLIAARREQIERWGHTPEKDAEKPLYCFLKDCEAQARGLVEAHHFDPAELGRLRRRAVKFAAYALATITRIDAEIGEQLHDSGYFGPECPL